MLNTKLWGERDSRELSLPEKKETDFFLMFEGDGSKKRRTSDSNEKKIFRTKVRNHARRGFRGAAL